MNVKLAWLAALALAVPVRIATRTLSVTLGAFEAAVRRHELLAERARMSAMAQNPAFARMDEYLSEWYPQEAP